MNDMLIKAVSSISKDSLSIIFYNLYNLKYKFLRKTLKSLGRNAAIQSADAINYLTRYSNNLIALSQLQTIDIAPSESSKDWLYRNYVYSR